jgi:hypothetical protein
MDEGKVQALVVNIASPPELDGLPDRILTEREQRLLLVSKRQIHNYLTRILQTPPKPD